MFSLYLVHNTSFSCFVDIVLSEPPTNVRDLKCELCELIVRKVDEGLGKNASKAEINSTIYKICDDLSGTTKTYVSSSVDIQMKINIPLSPRNDPFT